MITFEKRNLIAISIGFIIGLFLLVINSLFSSYENSSVVKNNINDSQKIKYFTLDDKDKLLNMTLVLFGFKLDNINSKDGGEASNELLASLENITIKIIAQANIANDHRTLLEVTASGKTERISVREGITVNGFLIKSINNKRLVVEKNSIEYSIKLFHPKELNLTKTEQKNDLK